MTCKSIIRNRIRGSTWVFRWQYRLRRWQQGWRYATDRMTADDAGWIRYRCQAVEGFWPLEFIDAESVLREARERWHDHPALSRLAFDAAERIGDKWCASGDISGEARGCAVDLIAKYAKAQDVELIERDVDIGAAEEGELRRDGRGQAGDRDHVDVA